MQDNNCSTMDDTTFDRRETADRNVGFLLNDSGRLMRVNYDRRMRELGGEIHCHTDPGKGTLFTVKLPMIESCP